MRSSSRQEEMANYALRAPGPLLDRVRKQAIANRRSLNSEIIVLLEHALTPEKEKAETAATVSAE